MAEQGIAYSADKATAYRQLADEIAAVVAGETSRTARYATTVSLLKAAFGERFFWCGFYEVDPRKERELVVGPYQGTLGCLRIPFAKGVCGACATARETIIVPDVHVFPGHIACDSASNSEIVVPVFDTNQARWLPCLTWIPHRLRRSTRSMRVGLRSRAAP
jgi:L-methionine (R)-S-oxide reductase